MLALCGGRNLFADLNAFTPTVGEEAVLAGIKRWAELTQQARDLIVDQGDSVLVFPGAAREAFRTYRDRRNINLGGRTGFVARALRRGRQDLRMLSTVIDGERVPLGGVPWFVAPFGREMAFVGLETLLLDLRCLPASEETAFADNLGGFACS